MSLTYKQAGVDIDAGDYLVERIKPLAAATRIAEVMSGVGGFAGLCRVPSDVVDPVLVSGTDGVGTKLKVAFATGVHDTIGIDLVGMCVNDVLTCGARPLFFLDYFATGKLDVGVAEKVIAGIAAACTECGCALLGGETAELPGMYAPGEYDLAGFAVGVVARSKIVDGSRVSAGDVALGVRSSGLHSNGYALARAVLFESMKLTVADRPRELGGKTLGEALLAPTRLYIKSGLEAMRSGSLKGFAHITGGCITENLPRALPEGLDAEIDLSTWTPLPVFGWLSKSAGIEEREMLRTFNCGIGLNAVVAEKSAGHVIDAFQESGERAYRIGHLVKGDGEAKVRYRGTLKL